MNLSVGKNSKLTTEKACRDLYAITEKEYIKFIAYDILCALVLSIVFYRNLYVFIFSLPIIVLVVIKQGRDARLQKKEQLIQEFMEFLGVLSSFLRAGYSLENAYKQSVLELKRILPKDSKIYIALEEIKQKIELNTSLETLFRTFSIETQVEDIMCFAEILEIASKSGGNMVDIILNTSETIHAKLELKRSIDSVLAEKKYEQKIMQYIPILIIIYLSLSSGDFINGLYTTLTGRIISTVCLGIYFLAIYLQKRILAIEI